MATNRSCTLSDIVETLTEHFPSVEWTCGDVSESTDQDIVIDGIADLEVAGSRHISFLSNARYLPFLKDTNAAIVIVGRDVDVPAHLSTIRLENPYLAYALISRIFDDRLVGEEGIHPTATIDPTATVHKTAIIGAQCVVGAHSKIGAKTELQAGVVVGACSDIGASCLLYANCTIYHGVSIGDRVRIHSGSAIGSDGFGYSPSPSGWVKIHQLGGVIIGNDVEIGSCTSIDRGAIDDTVICDGVIIDNQVHIAHNVRIGKKTAIAGCVGIAGSTTVGENCTMGGFVAINGHLTIADNVHFNGGSVVTKSIKEPGAYSSGTILQDVKSWRKAAVRFSQLESWIDRIKKLEKVNK